MLSPSSPVVISSGSMGIAIGMDNEGEINSFDTSSLWWDDSKHKIYAAPNFNPSSRTRVIGEAPELEEGQVLVMIRNKQGKSELHVANYSDLDDSQLLLLARDAKGNDIRFGAAPGESPATLVMDHTMPYGIRAEGPASNVKRIPHIDIPLDPGAAANQSSGDIIVDNQGGQVTGSGNRLVVQDDGSTHRETIRQTARVHSEGRNANTDPTTTTVDIAGRVDSRGEGQTIVLNSDLSMTVGETGTVIDHSSGDHTIDRVRSQTTIDGTLIINGRRSDVSNVSDRLYVPAGETMVIGESSAIDRLARVATDTLRGIIGGDMDTTEFGGVAHLENVRVLSITDGSITEHPVTGESTQQWIADFDQSAARGLAVTWAGSKEFGISNVSQAAILGLTSERQKVELGNNEYRPLIPSEASDKPALQVFGETVWSRDTNPAPPGEEERAKSPFFDLESGSVDVITESIGTNGGMRSRGPMLFELNLDEAGDFASFGHGLLTADNAQHQVLGSSFTSVPLTGREQFGAGTYIFDHRADGGIRLSSQPADSSIQPTVELITARNPNHFSVAQDYYKMETETTSVVFDLSGNKVGNAVRKFKVNEQFAVQSVGEYLWKALSRSSGYGGGEQEEIEATDPIERMPDVVRYIERDPSMDRIVRFRGWLGLGN